MGPKWDRNGTEVDQRTVPLQSFLFFSLTKLCLKGSYSTSKGGAMWVAPVGSPNAGPLVPPVVRSRGDAPLRLVPPPASPLVPPPSFPHLRPLSFILKFPLSFLLRFLLSFLLSFL